MSLTTCVLIRTKNEAKYISKTLELISNQSLKVNDIVVVDSGSTDGTVDIVKQWSDVKLIQIQPEEFTFGRSLNIGFEATKGEIVVILSAHAFPYNQYWLQKLVKHFDDPGVAGTYGKQLPQPDAWPPVEQGYLKYYGDQIRIQTDSNNYYDHSFSNANAAIRRSCWNKHCFDETLGACEDREWAWAMLRLGYKIIYEPEAAVYHSHNESLIKVYHRIYRETLANQLIYDSKISWHYAVKRWYDAVLADIHFILKNNKAHNWILRVPIYRLFWAYGILRPSLPTTIWEPFFRPRLKDGSSN